MTLNILGVVPARGGSKTIPRKNLLKLGSKTLLELAIDSALASTLINRVIVSTEDDELAEVGRNAGAETPFMRPAELANDTAGTWPVMQHAATWLKEHEGWSTDIIVVLQPTTPFRKGTHIDSTIQKLLDTGAESCITVREVDYSPYWMLHIGEDGQLNRLMQDGSYYARRQDTPTVYQPNGLVYAMRYDVLMRDPKLPGRDTQGVPMSFEDSVNIDNWWQYRLAELLWEERVQ